MSHKQGISKVDLRTKEYVLRWLLICQLSHVSSLVLGLTCSLPIRRGFRCGFSVEDWREEGSVDGSAESCSLACQVVHLYLSCVQLGFFTMHSLFTLKVLRIQASLQHMIWYSFAAIFFMKTSWR